MTSFTLKGLLTRKLRTALTAIAIILGVATVDRHVRADRLDRQGVQLDLHRGLQRNTDATITPKSPFDTGDGLRDDRGRLRRVAAGEGPGSAGRRGRDRRRGERERAARPGREGDRLRRRPESRLLGRPVQAEVQHAHARPGQLAGQRTRSWSTSRPRTRRTWSLGSTIGVQVEGPVEMLQDLRVRQVRLGGLDRRRHAERLRPPDRAAALRQGGQARPDPRRLRSRASHPTASSRRSARSCRRTRRSAPGRRRRRRTRRRPTSSSRSCATSCSRSA